MIYTVTLNPAIDYVVKLEKLTLGAVNRSFSESISFGGKGINVSLVLNELGISSVALGFCGGFTGAAIESYLNEQNINTDFVHLLDVNSRINVKIKAECESEINGNGPEINEEAVSEFYKKLENINSGDTLIIGGSIPKSLPSEFYAQMLDKISNKNILTVVDTTGNSLLKSLKYRPFLIKPNLTELGEIFGIEPTSYDEIVYYAKKLQDKGALNVLVSMAGDGSILVDENGKNHSISVCNGQVKNSVGAGDSMLAGFLAGYMEKHDYEYALKLGTACGGATAFSEGLAQKNTIIRLLEEL